MKKFLRFCGFALVGFGVLVGLLAVAIKITVTPERVRAFVEQKAASELHREVKLGGISVGLFSGLTVTDFSLSESPAFSKGTFISSEKFQVVPQLLPLLSKKIFIDQLILIKPEVKVVREADGKTFNFSSLTSSSPSNSPSSSASAPSPIAFLVSKVVIEAGHLSFQDRSPAAQSADIAKLNVKVRNVSLVAPVDLQTSFDVKAKGMTAGIDFEGTVSALKGSAKIKKLDLTSGGSKIHAAGDADELTGKQPAFDVKVQIVKLEPAFLAGLGAVPSSIRLKNPVTGEVDLKGDLKSLESHFKFGLGALELSGQGTVKDAAEAKRKMKFTLDSNSCPIETLLAFLPPDTLPKDVRLGGSTQISASVDGTADRGDMALKIDGQPLDIAYSTYFMKTAGTPLTVNVSGKYALPLAIAMNDIRVTLGKVQLSGAGTYKSAGAASNYVFDIKTNAFPLEDLSPLVPPLKAYGLAGNASATVKAVSAPQGPNIKGTAKLLGASMNYEGVKLSNIVSTVDFTKTSAAGTLTSDLIKHDYFSGQALKLTWDLKEVTEMAKINGNAALRIGKGEFQNIQKLTADSKAAKILLLPISMLQKLDNSVHGALQLPDFNHIAYQEILGDYVFKAGVMTVSRFDLNGDQVAANMKGTVGLTGAQALNLTGQVKVAAGALAGAVQGFNDAQGRTTLNLIVKGTVSDPHVSVDMADVGKKVLESVKDKLGGQPAQQIQNLLKGLFKN